MIRYRFEWLDLLNTPQRSVYDGGEGGDDTGGDNTGGDNQGGDGGNGGDVGKLFTQDDVNRFLADDRRKHKAKIDELQDQLETVKMSDEQREALESRLESLQSELESKEEKAKREKAKIETQYKEQLTQLQTQAKTWEQKYRESTINRSLKDAAVEGDAFNPDQVVLLLRQQTKIETDEDGVEHVKVFIEEVDETGETKTLSYSPKEAIEMMRDKPEKYGNLFKHNVVSGVGGNSATGGLTPGKDGRVDLSRLTPEQYRQLRKDNPTALGLRARN
jgi:hypothetical protein